MEDLDDRRDPIAAMVMAMAKPEVNGGGNNQRAAMPERIERTYGAACPVCRTHLPADVIRLDRPFECSTCGSQLCVHKSYSTIKFGIALICAIAVAYAVGARGVVWFLAVVLSLFPTMVMLTMVTQRLVPPPISICDAGTASRRDVNRWDGDDAKDDK